MVTDDGTVKDVGPNDLSTVKLNNRYLSLPVSNSYNINFEKPHCLEFEIFGV